MGEYRGFIFAITFIIFFAGLVVAVPSGLEGQGLDPDGVVPLDTAVIFGFEDYENWTMTALNAYDQYQYTFNLRDWWFGYYAGTVQFGAKIIYAGFLWLGQLDSCEFISSEGVNRGTVLSYEEIDTDAENGTASYNLLYLVNGADAGGFVFYWNSTEYESSLDAFIADDVNFMHGVGIASTAPVDITSLLVGLLLLQLPNCPPLINLLLATPVYAAVVFLIWFIIKESMPFV